MLTQEALELVDEALGEGGGALPPLEPALAHRDRRHGDRHRLAAVLLLGAPLGLLWAVVAPEVPVLKTTDCGTAEPTECVVVPSAQPEQFIAADGWFGLLGLVFGVLAAIAGWLLLRRYRGPVTLAVVVLGCLGAALLAWRVGRQIGLEEFQQLLATSTPGETFGKPADLRAGGLTWLYEGEIPGLRSGIPVLTGVVLLPAFGAAVMYTLLAGWSRWPSLMPERAADAVPVWAAGAQWDAGQQWGADEQWGADGQWGAGAQRDAEAHGGSAPQSSAGSDRGAGPDQDGGEGERPGLSSDSTSPPAPPAAPERPGPGAAGPSPG